LILIYVKKSEIVNYVTMNGNCTVRAAVVEVIPRQRDGPLLANYLLSVENKGFWAFPSGITRHNAA
jgi:hypothetical protein